MKKKYIIIAVVLIIFIILSLLMYVVLVRQDVSQEGMVTLQVETSDKNVLVQVVDIVNEEFLTGPTIAEGEAPIIFTNLEPKVYKIFATSTVDTNNFCPFTEVVDLVNEADQIVVIDISVVSNPSCFQ